MNSFSPKQPENNQGHTTYLSRHSRVLAVIGTHFLLPLFILGYGALCLQFSGSVSLRTMRVFALALYVGSYVVKAFRLYLILHRHSVRFTTCFLVHILSIVIGLSTFLFVQEIAVILLFVFLVPGQKLKSFSVIASSVFYLRLLDFVALSFFLMLPAFAGNPNFTLAAFVFMTVSGLLLIILFFSESVFSVVIRSLFNRSHSKWSRKAVRLVAEFRNSMKRDALFREGFFYIQFLLSALAWMLEIFALYLVSSETGIIESIEKIGYRVFSSAQVLGVGHFVAEIPEYSLLYSGVLVYGVGIWLVFLHFYRKQTTQPL